MADDQQIDPAQALREFGAAMWECMDAIARALQPVIDAVIEACRAVYSFAQARYRDAGAIYGDTHDGMLRWWCALIDAERMRREADAFAARRQLLADLRAHRL